MSKTNKMILKSPKEIKNHPKGNFFLNYLRSHDDYGQSVSFNYKGKDTYQTSVGAVCSIVAKTVFIVCFVFRSLMMYNMEIFDLDS
jgi:hypothetical protein